MSLQKFRFVLLLVIICCQVALFALPGHSQTRVLIAPDSTTVTIDRDNYGVPHIQGASAIGVFFAQGFAVAEDRLFQLELFRRAGQGRLAEMLGPGYTNMDKRTRQLYYTEQE
ncbi:MAG: hypothetical protein D6814_10370, partial [Calditrichaeota bacterium]